MAQDQLSPSYQNFLFLFACLGFLHFTCYLVPNLPLHRVSPQLPTMADMVQYRLERTVNELDDLERRVIFSRREIAEIVKQRRKFEYRLKRPSPLKQDYLAYIEYEKQVDSLRRLRKKSIVPEAKKKMKKSVFDFAGVSRILDIY